MWGKCAYVAFAVFTIATKTIENAFDLSSTALSGIYEVEQFTRNGEPVPPLLTDSTRWRRIAIERSGAASVWLMNDEQRSFITAADSEQGRLTVVALPADPVRPLGLARTLRCASSPM